MRTLDRLSPQRVILTITLAAIPMVTAQAQTADEHDVAEIRSMLDALRDDYEQRIADLEQRLQRAEARAADAEVMAEDAAIAAQNAASASAPPVVTTTSPSAFNPGIGAVLVGTIGHLDNDPEGVEIPGFQLGGEPNPGDGLSLGESEINFNGSIDDKFFGNLTFALASEEGAINVELEEAWLQTTALPAGLQLTAGRFFSGFGYLNAFHRHADDFVDRPLPYRAFLGGQFLDDGLQLRWLAPTDHYLEFGGELLRGDKFPGGDQSDGMDAFSTFVKTGGDFGTDHSWKAGLSYLRSDVLGRTGGHGHGHEEAEGDDHEEMEGFFGDSDLYGVDLVYKWAPNGNARQRNLKLQAEYFWRDEKGLFDGLNYSGQQDGWYAQANYKFAPNWSVGYRYDQLEADNRGVDGTELEPGSYTPRRNSLIMQWHNSEYSRLRLQYIIDRSTEVDDDQLYLQYVMSFGAHRAHSF
ncbi:MAG: TonB-dependent receptor [Lysobacteraceae bacterium]|nr:MAG: TonB-dependent receptor [Xanthomonadaceae bacterium]